MKRSTFDKIFEMGIAFGFGMLLAYAASEEQRHEQPTN